MKGEFPVDKEQALQPAGNAATRARASVPPHLILLLGVLALTFIAYAGTLGFEFVYDDHEQIVGNNYVHSWRFAARYFTGHVWSNLYPHDPGNYYRPVFLLWLRVNHMLFGLNAWGWHLMTLLAHVIATLMVYFLAVKLARDHLTAGVAALIFGLHPVHIESVAWVSGVTEPLLAMLLIPSFLCYVHYRERTQQARWWLAASLLLYLLALLAKETAIVLPLMLPIYEWFFRPGAADASGPGAHGSRIRAPIVRIVPFLVVSAVYLVVRVLALKGLGHARAELPVSTVFLTLPSLLWFYIRLLVWPVGLSAFYARPYVADLTVSGVLLPAAGVAGAAIGLGCWCRRSRAVAYASLWLALTLLPVLNLKLFAEGDYAHDRYLYLPSVGFSIIAALALGHLRVGRWRLLGQPAVHVVAGTVLAVLLGLGTVFQSLHWADDLLLASHGLRFAPNNIYAKTVMANVAGERGLSDAAIVLYEQVIAQDPNFWMASYNLGYLYYKLGKLEEAERHLARAAALTRVGSRPYIFLGLTRLRMGRVDEAEVAIRQAIALQPEGVGNHFALAVVLKMQGNLKGALEEFKLELANNPAETATRQQIAEIEARLRGSSAGQSPVPTSPPSLPAPER